MGQFGKSSLVVRIRSVLEIEAADEAEVMIEEIEEERQKKEEKKEEYLPNEENYLSRQLRTMRILPKDDLPVVYKDDPERTEREKKARKDAEAEKNKPPARVPVKAPGMAPKAVTKTEAAKPKADSKKADDASMANLVRAGDLPEIPGQEYTATEVRFHVDELIAEYDQDGDEHLFFDEAQRLVWDKEDEQLSPEEFNLVCRTAGADPELGWDAESLLVYLTFMRIDLNENGRLSYEEVSQWQRDIGTGNPIIADFVELCNKVGADADRGLNLEQFVKLQAIPKDRRPGNLLGKPNKTSVLARNK